MRSRLFAAVALSAALMSAGLLVFFTEGASASSNGSIVETLVLPSLGNSGKAHIAAAAGMVTVYVEVPSRFDRRGIPARLTDVPVRTVPLGEAHRLSIPLTGSAVYRAANRAGLATFDFRALVGNRIAMSEISLPVLSPSGRGFVAAAGLVRSTLSRSVRFSRWFTIRSAHGAEVARPSLPSYCSPWSNNGTWEGAPRLGQLQVSNSTGAYGNYNLSTQADSTFDVGISLNDPTGNYGFSGTFSMTNTWSGNGGFQAGGNANTYANGHSYIVRYTQTCAGQGTWYKTRYNSLVGDSYPTGGSPGGDPWGRCGSDPYGKAQLANNGYYSQTSGTGYHYSAVGSFFGFTVGGSSGYDTHVYISYTNHAGNWLFVCGDNYLPYAHVLWENNLNGH